MFIYVKDVLRGGGLWGKAVLGVLMTIVANVVGGLGSVSGVRGGLEGLGLDRVADLVLWKDACNVKKIEIPVPNVMMGLVLLKINVQDAQAKCVHNAISTYLHVKNVLKVLVYRTNFVNHVQKIVFNAIKIMNNVPNARMGLGLPAMEDVFGVWRGVLGVGLRCKFVNNVGKV